MTKQSDNKKKTTENKTAKLPIAKNTVIKITISAKDTKEAYQKGLNKLARNIKISGFRKGKVPAKLAEDRLEPGAIIQEALHLILPDLYTKEIKKANKKPLTHPEFNPISIKKDEEWILEAHIAERPEVKLGDYKKVIKKAKTEAEKLMDEQVKKLQKEQEDKAKEAKIEQEPKIEPSNQEKRDFALRFIYSKLVEAINPKIPELLIKEEVRHDLRGLQDRLKQINIPFENFLKQRGITFEQLSGELAMHAVSRIQVAFIIDEIIKLEKLKEKEVADFILNTT
jgi:FKBP-type peptidyl-prolyl cis-trans isomerase (trigger factor)